MACFVRAYIEYIERGRHAVSAEPRLMSCYDDLIPGTEVLLLTHPVLLLRSKIPHVAAVYQVPGIIDGTHAKYIHDLV